ncbi:ORF4 [Cnidium closterovirus 1]|nr:ORF4 [Cnidium closterovirus 1]
MTTNTSIQRRAKFARRSWGDLFKRFYGEPVWKDYLSETLNSKLVDETHKFEFSDGSVFYSNHSIGTSQDSAEREFDLLLKSENIFKWCQMCAVPPSMSFSDYNVTTESLPQSNMIEVDVKTVGCKFHLADLRVALGSDAKKREKAN